jgi:uncharacterized OB-fold protein
MCFRPTDAKVLPNKCPECGAVNVYAATACMKCGAALRKASVPAAPNGMGSLGRLPQTSVS